MGFGLRRKYYSYFFFVKCEIIKSAGGLRNWKSSIKVLKGNTTSERSKAVRKINIRDR